jgi:DNA-binding response OmpR family regulator
MEEKNKKILIIEDDPFLSDMYATKFQLKGYKVNLSKNGEEAMEEIKKEKPAIILLDILMPKMDGYEFLGKLKRDERLKDIPVVIMTNLGQKKEVEKGLELGADDYIIKAYFTPKEVIEKVESLLNSSK